MPNKIKLLPTLHRRDHFMAGVSKAAYLNLTTPAIVNTRYQDNGSTAIIDIDGFIGRDVIREMLTGEKSKNTVENIRQTLREISSDKIIVNINSPGGDLNDGLVIYDMLKAKRAEIVTNVMGFSASAATLIAQAGTIRRQSREGFQLIHRVMFGLMGYFNQNTFQELIEDADTIDPVLMRVYANGAGLTTNKVAEIMDAGGGYGRWIDAEEALELGLIDEIYDAAEQDDNTDRLSPEDRAEMKRNVQALARAGASAASNSDRQARLKEIEQLDNRQREIENRYSETDGEIDMITNSEKLPHVKDYAAARMAYHEAGHAIIGKVLGEKVTEIELHRRLDGGPAGSCLFERGNTAMRQSMKPWQYVAVSVAGSIAEYGYHGKSMKGFKLIDLNGDPEEEGSDAYNVNEFVNELSAGESGPIVAEGIRFAASRLIRNWKHVQSLANELNNTGVMNANAFDRWFNASTKYDEFYR